jgi:hypothetical protein
MGGSRGGVRMNDLQELAQAGIDRGWSIIPCGVVGTSYKRSLVEWAPNQTRRATSQEVTRWLSTLSKKVLSLAVVTGDISGLVILDFDGEAVDQVEKWGLKPHVKTGSGGFHVYFKHPGHRVKTLNSKADEALGAKFPGLDIRGDGGYAIFAGESDKGSYETLRDPTDLDQVDILPREVQEALGLILAPERVNKAPQLPIPTLERGPVNARGSQGDLGARKLEQAKAKAGNGEGRNNTGHWLSCQLRDNGISQGDADSLMREYQESVTSLPDGHGQATPYTWEEARTTLESNYKDPPREKEGYSDFQVNIKPKPIPLGVRSRSLFGSMFSLGQLLSQPDKGWYLQDFLGPQEIVMIAGQPGSGKTFLVLDLLLSLSLEKDWGRGAFQYQHPEPLRVAYFAGEGTGRLGKRIEALLSGHKATLEDVGDRFQVFGGVPNLSNSDDPNSVLKIVEEYKTRNLPFPQVVVIDTLARSTPGSDENSSRDAGLVIQALDYLKEELGCSVIVVHHTGKTGETERGSSALRGAVDALYKVVKNGRGSLLTCEKAKDAEEFPDLPFTLLTIEESCCVSWSGPPPANPYLTLLRERRGERLPLSVIHEELNKDKSNQVTRNQLNKLVEAGRIQTDNTKGKPQVWWVDLAKPGTILLNFDEGGS